MKSTAVFALAASASAQCGVPVAAPCATGGCVQTVTKIVDVPQVQWVDRPCPVPVPNPVPVPTPVPNPVRVEVRRPVPCPVTRAVPVPTPCPVEQIREVVKHVHREVIQNVQQPVPTPCPVPVPNIQYCPVIQTRSAACADSLPSPCAQHPVL